MKKRSFTRKERLKENKAIRSVFDKGAPFRSKLVTIFLLKRNKTLDSNRVAFVIKKTLYNKKSVLRNRFKRILREAYRKTKDLLPLGYDIVILATNLTKDTKTAILEKELANVFKKCIKK